MEGLRDWWLGRVPSVYHFRWGCCECANPTTRLPPIPAAAPSSRLVEQGPERRLHGVGPDPVALAAQVQVVRHDFPRDRAVGLQEGLADIEELDVGAVVEPGDLGVDGVELLAECVRLLPAREDAQE